MASIVAGQRAPAFTVEDIAGRPIALDGYRGSFVLLMFFRYASCPMCNLRLRDFGLAYGELERRGVRAVAFFHSSRGAIARHAGALGLRFPLVPDPAEEVYRTYGVGRSWWRLLRSALLPSFYVDWARAMRHGFWGGASWRMDTMPADFLIDPDGVVAKAHYGGDIGDHMPVAAILDALDRRTEQALRGPGSALLTEAQGESPGRDLSPASPPAACPA